MGLVAPGAAYAHTGAPASAYFQNISSPPNYAAAVDPRPVVSTAGAHYDVSFDVGWVSCGSTASNRGWNFKYYWLNSSGTVLGGLAGTSQMTMAANYYCPNNGAPGLHNSVSTFGNPGQLSMPPTGMAGIKIVAWSNVNSVEQTHWEAWTHYAPPAPPAPTGLGLISSAAPGKLLSYDQVAGLGYRAGWTSEQALTEMVAVTRGESSFRTGAVSYTGCCHGLMQVNTEVHPYTIAQMRDPVQNVDAGRTIYEAAGSWQPWQAYTGPDGSGSDGPWLDFEDAANAAAKRARANGGAAADTIANAPNSGDGSITVGWTNACTGSPSCSFDVERAQGAGSFQRVKTAQSGTTYTDNSAADATAYSYRVRATNANGNSEWVVVNSLTAGQADADAGWSDAAPEDAGSDADGSNSGTGEDCWSINPLTVLKCALRWAFVPGESTSTAWEEFANNMQTRPPFSIVVGVGSYVLDFTGMLQDEFNAQVAGGSMDACLQFGEFGPLAETDPACVGDSLRAMAENFWVGVLRTLAVAGLLFSTLLVLWKTLKSGFSDAPETEGGELKPDPDVSEEKDAA